MKHTKYFPNSLSSISRTLFRFISLQITDLQEDLLAFLILDIKTIPLPSIDETVDEAVRKKVNSYIERTGDNPENAKSLL